MPVTFSLTLHFPLPPTLSPEQVVRNLHAYEPLIVPNPYLQGFRRLPVELDDVVNDPFFTEDGTNIVSYEIHDRIPVVGFLGISKETKFPAIFQSFGAGVRVKVEAAAGVKVRSVYEVCPKRHHQQQDDGFPMSTTTRRSSGSSSQDSVQDFYNTQAGALSLAAGGEWELVERSRVECGALLKPFVMKSFEAAHRDLCQKVLNNAMGPRDQQFSPTTGIAL